MEFYRVMHKPTGLYYKPGKPNLSRKGKVYTAGGNVLNYYSSDNYVPCHLTKAQHEEFGHKYPHNTSWSRTPEYLLPARIPKEEFVMEPVNV